MTILEPKQEKKIFLKIYFFCKMLIFQDFLKFSKILKSTVQYLCRDISNVKIGLYLRSSHKKDWKTHFWPYSLKKSKKWKKKTRAPPHFSVSFRQKNFSENRTTVAMCLAPPPSPRHSKSSTPVYILKFSICLLSSYKNASFCVKANLGLKLTSDLILECSIY